jgi:hypothetical protein
MQIAILVDKIHGYAKASPFSFSYSITAEPHESITSLLWNFGDGISSEEPSPSHIYSFPNDYNVRLTVNGYNSLYDMYFSREDTKNIKVSLYLNESVYFNFVPPPTFASHYQRYPFRVNITSSKVGDHYIELGAQFSRSYQNQIPQNKWSFLRPEWKFLDLNGNLIERIKTTDNIIKIDEQGKISPNGRVVGVSGFAEFYFIDDIYNSDLAASQKPYTTIIATLQTSAIRGFNDSSNINDSLPGFSNSLATATCPVINLWRTPESLKVSENGIRDFSNPRWASSKNPIIVSSIYGENSYPDDWVDGNGVKIYNYNSHFSHNYPLSTNNVNVNLHSVGISANFTPYPALIKSFDNDLYKTPGYYKGYFYTQITQSLNSYISANALIPTPTMSANYIQPILWVSNPAAGLMMTAQYQFQSNLSAVTTPNLSIAHVYPFEVPIITEPDFTNDPMALSGFHGINSIAALPAPNFHAWASDGELNKLYRFSTNGSILCSVDIRKIIENNNLGYLVPNQISPASIALDSQRNIWMTLYDTLSVLKFDYAGNFLFATTPLSTTGYTLPTPANLPRLLEVNSRYDQESYYYSTTYDDVNLIEPTCLDTDIEDNVWVSYSNTFSSFLIKYNQSGELLYSYNYPLCTNTQEIVTDSSGYVWIALSHLSYGDYSFIEKRNSFGTLLSTFGPFRGINYLTLDSNQNPWFTYSYSRIGKINNTTATVSTLNLSGSDITTGIPDWIYINRNTDETALEGISSDIRGKIYVINSVENQIYVVNSNTFSIENKFYLNPQGFSYFIKGQFEPTTVDYNIWSKSAQAQGDWSGWRWINKYGTSKLPYYSYASTDTVYLTGVSRNLNFYITNPYEIFKINENYDLTQQMQNVTFIQSLLNSPFLYKNFLPTIFGKYPFKHEDLAVSLYEKIANFSIDHSDIDYANVQQLYSFLEQIDLNVDNFMVKYPFDIERLMDLTSINKSRLWGCRSLDQENFNRTSEEGVLNRGELISSSSYLVSAGIPIILKSKSLNQYRYIPTGLLHGLSTYSLNDLVSTIGLNPATWDDYYEFYNFTPGSDKKQLEGIIDWNNPQTTLVENLSSVEFWEDTEGAIESMFSYYLYKGLDLL